MTKLSDLTAFLAIQIRADLALKTFCLENFSKEITIFDGQDENELPEETHCPFIVFDSGGRSMSGGMHMKSGEVAIGTVFKKDVKGSLVNGIQNFPGKDLIEPFFDELVRIFIEAKHVSKQFVYDFVPGQSDKIEFPYFKFWIGLSVQYDSGYRD